MAPQGCGLTAKERELADSTVSDRSMHQVPSHVPPEKIYEFDLLDDPRARADVHGLFSELHRGAPDIFYAPGRHGGWVVRPLSMIVEVLQKPELFSSKGQFATLAQIVGGDFGLIPLEVDPPSHLKYRMLLNPIFSPKRVAAMEERIRLLASQLVDGFASKGRCDIVTDYAQTLYPRPSLAEIIGPTPRTASLSMLPGPASWCRVSIPKPPSRRFFP